MMKEILTALITPFQSDGSVDASTLRKLVHTQMEEGADGFIVCGTTAETPTLTREEQRQIIETVLSLTTGRCKVYAGVGTNCTATTIANICSFERYPLDGYLLVTPYYNRPSEEGLFRHFQAAAAVTRKTIMLYHVPSRTASSITVALFERLLAVCPNITALKYAASDYQAMAAFKRRHPQICLYSGEDASCFAAMQAGFDGVVSVMSHLQMPAMRKAIETEDPALIEQLQTFAGYCFLGASPAPVKYMLSRRSQCENILRLPLCPIDASIKKRLDEEALPLNDRLRSATALS